jgi:electron transfer flavoprotein alpha subunit
VAVHALSLVADASVAEAHGAVAAAYGASCTHAVLSPALSDFGPAAWGAAVAAWCASHSPVAVVATGTDRGNEVLAHLGAQLDVAFAANCYAVSPGEAGGAGGAWTLTRSRWGGSLLEDATLDGTVRVLSFVHHSVEPVPAGSAASVNVVTHPVELDASLAASVVAEREVPDTGGGATLSTARVVVGGGRGVGSAEGFSVLEELAALLGGKVGCSRAVTNNGWRNHTDQVGQTGTRIAPEIYLACGISGAIQHWVGAMASKKILAINTDPEANMVTRADYAVIGDLHQVVPAISAEIRRRQGG